MQKLFLLLLLAASLSPSVSAQTNIPQISWSDDHKVVVNALPDPGQPLVLPINPRMKEGLPDLRKVCEEMTNSLAKWTVSEKDAELLIFPNRELYPDWSGKDWEMYFNRMVMVYLQKG